jgi:hypothetical protein
MAGAGQKRAVSGWMTGDYRCPRGTVFCRRWNRSSRDGASARGGEEMRHLTEVAEICGRGGRRGVL